MSPHEPGGMRVQTRGRAGKASPERSLGGARGRSHPVKLATQDQQRADWQCRRRLFPESLSGGNSEPRSNAGSLIGIPPTRSPLATTMRSLTAACPSSLVFSWWREWRSATLPSAVSHEARSVLLLALLFLGHSIGLQAFQRATDCNGSTSFIYKMAHGRLDLGRDPGCRLS
jgi:hypothetical protein